MDKVARAKEVIYATIRRNNASVEEYAASKQGMSIIKRAAVLKSAAPAPSGSGNVFYSILSHLANPNDPVRKMVAYGAGGGAAGYALGRSSTKLTAPSDDAVSNMQKREMIAEYDTAIEDITNRIAAKAL